MATMMSFGEGSEACLTCTTTICISETLSKYGHFHLISHALPAIQGPWVSHQVKHCYLRPSIIAMGTYGNNDELWRGL